MPSQSTCIHSAASNTGVYKKRTANGYESLTMHYLKRPQHVPNMANYCGNCSVERYNCSAAVICSMLCSSALYQCSTPVYGNAPYVGTSFVAMQPLWM